MSVRGVVRLCRSDRFVVPEAFASVGPTVRIWRRRRVVAVPSFRFPVVSSACVVRPLYEVVVAWSCRADPCAVVVGLLVVPWGIPRILVVPLSGSRRSWWVFVCVLPAGRVVGRRVDGR